MAIIQPAEITDATSSNFCFGLGIESGKLIQTIAHFSYSLVHFNHRMFGLDSSHGHMSLNYKYLMDVCRHAFSDSISEDKKRKKMANPLLLRSHLMKFYFILCVEIFLMSYTYTLDLFTYTMWR